MPPVTAARQELQYPKPWLSLVDAQFEEKHIEIGLEALSNFIAPGFAPSVPELLILCHLTLQDASETSTSAGSSLLPETSSSLPLPHTALILLRRLLASNTPALLGRCLPSCDPLTEPWYDLVELSDLERKGRKMMHWKDFWEGWERCGGDKMEVKRGEERTAGKDAKARDRWWTLAGWAVDLWQKDMENVWAWNGEGAPPIPLLLAQLPPTNQADPLAQRWELYRPLQVLLSAFANLSGLGAEGAGFLILPKEADELDGANWDMRRGVALKLLELLFALATPSVAHPRPLLSPQRLIDQLAAKLSTLPTSVLLLMFPIQPSLSSTSFASALAPLKLRALGSVILDTPLQAAPTASMLSEVLAADSEHTPRRAVLELVLFQTLARTDREGLRAAGPWRARLEGLVATEGEGEAWNFVKAFMGAFAERVDAELPLP